MPQNTEADHKHISYYEQNELDRDGIRRGAVHRSMEIFDTLPNLKGKIYEIMRNAVKDPNADAQDIINNIVAISRGFSAELLSAGVGSDECMNVIAINANHERVPEHTQNIRLEDYYARHKMSPRKDHILYRSLVNESLNANNNISPKDSEKLLSIVDEIFSSEQLLRDKWSKEHPGRFCTTPELIKWQIANNKGFNEISESLNNETMDSFYQALNTAYKVTYKDRKTEGKNSLYNQLTLGDSFVVDEDGKRIYAIIEVKAYTNDEFTLLAHTASTLKPNENPEQQGVFLQLASIRYGLNISGLRKMAEMTNNYLNSEPTNIDLVDPTTAEVTTIEKKYYKYPDYNKDNFPVILRLAEDIDDESIKIFARALNDLGINDVIIQKIPFSEDDISLHSLGIMTKLVKGKLHIQNALESVGINDPDKRNQIMEGLVTRSNYFIENS